MSVNKVNHPVNLLETEVGREVSELLAHGSLQLSSGHQAWLLMAILYLVERERRKLQCQCHGRGTGRAGPALLRAVGH